MLRQSFDAKIERLQDELLILGSMVEKALIQSVDAFRARDLTQAWKLLAEDGTIGRQRAAVEAETLVLISTQQPVAGDLRTLVAVLEIAAELARMGDLTGEIDKLSLMLGHHALPAAGQISGMADKVRTMLHLALTAFAERDLLLAQSIPDQDDEVDRDYERIHRSLPALRQADHDWEHCLQLLKVAHHLERTADRVVNICEWVVYAETGELVEFDGATV
jgi:phosphate transport system protein